MLSHLLSEPGFRPIGLLERCASTELPLVEITPGVATVTQERGRMTLAELIAALETQRRARSSRKARIPLFEPIIGADEITLPIFVGAILTADAPTPTTATPRWRPSRTDPARPGGSRRSS